MSTLPNRALYPALASTPTPPSTAHRDDAGVALQGVSRREALAGLGGLAVAGGLGIATSARAQGEASAARTRGGRFSEKVALVTGGTSGIGEASVRAFAREGAKVVFCGRREELGKSIAASVVGAGGQAMFVRADVSREAEVEAFVREAVRAHERIDVAFNCAGIDRPNSPMHETTDALFDEVIRVNLHGVFYSIKHEIKQMLGQTPIDSEHGSRGAIVNIASVGGYRGYGGIAGYSASKAGVLSLTRTAASEVSDKGIRVVSISPGPVVTPMLERAVNDWGLPGLDAFAAGAAVKRNSTAEECAMAVLWLASPEASYLAGGDLLWDGGYLLK